MIKKLTEVEISELLLVRRDGLLGHRQQLVDPVGVLLCDLTQGRVDPTVLRNDGLPSHETHFMLKWSK